MISHLGRYEIISELGRGAMGIVYKARDPLIERFVAIKSINLELLNPEQRKQFEARFYQEAKAAGHLNHPGIVTIHDLGESGDTAYIAMELMEGRELQHILEGAKRLSIEDALDMAIQVASALAFAHQRGIVHRDIKPSNIMVVGNNQVKVVDFGIAKMPTNLSLTREGIVLGSPLYMSPEQIESKGVDARSDIFSLGVVLFQMLTWQLPFHGEEAAPLMFQIVNKEPERPARLNPQISDRLEGVVLKCLEKNPGKRYASAQELEEDLRQCRDELLRVRMGLEDSYALKLNIKRLRRMATPGALHEKRLLVAGYIAMAVIFVLDWLTDSRNATIQMHMVYMFPLALVGFHCEKLRTVRIFFITAMVLQLTTLVIEPLPHYARVVLALLFIPSDIYVVYIARIARANFVEVAKLASYDGLTGLRNRLSFESILETELVKLKQKKGALSFAFVDLNNFRELNEARGYAAGDNALKLLASLLKENLRQFDSVARIGGDEFAILMPNTTAAECEAQCKHVAEKIGAALAAAALPISTSIGYATFERAPASISEIFLKAEKAMHIAQATGVPQAVNGYAGGQ